MKAILFLVVLFSQSAQADSLGCSAYINSGGGFVSGHCFNGNCTANIPSDTIDVRGNCGGPGGVTFQANGFMYGGFVNATCRNGWLSFYLSGNTTQLNGRCSNGGTFYGQAYFQGKYINGSCNENGMFNVYLSGQTTQVTGTCAGGASR